jgi:hypothetical protein
MDFPQIKKIQIRPLWNDIELDTGSTPVLQISCQRFIPKGDDFLCESYEAPDGETMTVTFPPFACVSGAENLIHFSIAELTLRR